MIAHRRGGKQGAKSPERSVAPGSPGATGRTDSMAQALKADLKRGGDPAAGSYTIN